jgi:hypothetical protein
VDFLLKIMKHDSFKQIPVVSKLLTPWIQ